MADERLRTLERTWVESGSFADENALVGERLRLGLVDDGNLDFARWIVNDDGRLYSGQSPTVECSLRAACLYTYLLACRYEREHRDLIRDGWSDPKKASPQWISTWHGIVGASASGDSYEWWPALFGSSRVGAFEALLEFVQHTNATTVWNGGAEVASRVNQQRKRLWLRCLHPLLVGHGLTELPPPEAVGRS